MQDNDLEEISCPFCSFKSTFGKDVQVHVLHTHKEQLRSPSKIIKVGESTSNARDVNFSHDGNECETEVCPICHVLFNLKYVEEHLALHATNENSQDADVGCSSNSTSASTRIVSLDSMLAREIETEEMRKNQEEMLNKQRAEEIQLQMLQEDFNMNPNDKVTFAQQATKLMEKAVGRLKMTTTDFFQKRFEMWEKLDEGLDDQSTVTVDVTLHLMAHISPTYRPDTRWLMCSQTTHYGRGPGDTGWGCGFRNLQMMLVTLTRLPVYADNLKEFKGQIPSIPRLQEMIEYAWSCGFDPNGREQLGGALDGTRKWIGATEAFVMLASLGLHCRIIDFDGTRAHKKTSEKLFEWIAEYFVEESLQSNATEQDPIVMLDVPILYVQHQGHSVSVAGVQYNTKRKVATNLIVLDPSLTSARLSSILSKSPVNMQTFLKPASWFREDKYQVVAVVGIASRDRFERQKIVDTLAEKQFVT